MLMRFLIDAFIRAVIKMLSYNFPNKFKKREWFENFHFYQFWNPWIFMTFFLLDKFNNYKFIFARELFFNDLYKLFSNDLNDVLDDFLGLSDGLNGGCHAFYERSDDVVLLFYGDHDGDGIYGLLQ